MLQYKSKESSSDDTIGYFQDLCMQSVRYMSGLAQHDIRKHMSFQGKELF